MQIRYDRVVRERRTLLKSKCQNPDVKPMSKSKIQNVFDI